MFSDLRAFADKQIDKYRLNFNADILEMAEKAGLPIAVEWPRFSVLKGIDGEFDFQNRTTKINEITLKSVDPKKIVAKALDIKKKLYDSVFEPQKFINGLLECYQELLKDAKAKGMLFRFWISIPITCCRFKARLFSKIWIKADLRDICRPIRS